MNYHVFIVDKTTFKYHLEYLFAGTGSGNKKVSFLGNPQIASIHHSTEASLVGMISDISKIRIGDKIIFYLQSYNNIPGRFFGVFKAASSAFFDDNNSNNYLKSKLNKAITFRIKIEPETVYPLGISEHSYLDSIENIEHPYQMCWSLIYRKLKGNRGCTMITEHEYNMLVKKLQAKNTHPYRNDITAFTYNHKVNGIEPTDDIHTYTGVQDSISIKERLLFKANNGYSYEVHLQTLIMQEYDSPMLRNILLPLPDEHCWIGNEVSCGVGMQRIDVLIKQEKDNNVFFKIIELKCVTPEKYILTNQLPWYIHWLSEYIIPNYTSKGKKVYLTPCVIAPYDNSKMFIEHCKEFNKYFLPTYKDKPYIITPVEYIYLKTYESSIKFSKVDY